MLPAIVTSRIGVNRCPHDRPLIHKPIVEARLCAQLVSTSCWMSLARRPPVYHDFHMSIECFSIAEDGGISSASLITAISPYAASLRDCSMFFATVG